jgi:radical SAM superfamily enzyme YgiQ (UPF0313 family)
LIIVSGDAYIAVIAGFLEAHGFFVGIIAQPDRKRADSFRMLGRPKLAWLITSGAIDSMVAHYPVSKKPGRTDTLTPGGRTGACPDRAVITYTSMDRRAYKDVPVVLGGLEASLRRLSHYDYRSETVRKSILLDAKADMIAYGMAGQSTLQIHPRTGGKTGLRRGPLSKQQMDEIYNLSYTRKPHPSYKDLGEIPALKEVSFSITSSRGCFGGCSFCAITSHQGRIIQGENRPDNNP